MYHYYLTPADAQSSDTIYVINTLHPTAALDAAYLVEHLGCERITRRVATNVDRVHRHTGRGSAWAQKESGFTSGETLNYLLRDAADATLETVDWCRDADERARF